MSHHGADEFFEAVYEMNAELIQSLMKRNAELKQTIDLMRVSVPSFDKALDTLQEAMNEEANYIDEAHDKGDTVQMQVLIAHFSKSLDAMKAMYDSACEDYRSMCKRAEKLSDKRNTNCDYSINQYYRDLEGR